MLLINYIKMVKHLNIYIKLITMSIGFVFLYQSCLNDPFMPEEFLNATIPSVETLKVTNKTATTITISGNVLRENGTEVTERGFCWSTGDSPEVTADNKIEVGEGLGAFTETVKSLLPNQTYRIRAYAINAKGIAYGDIEEVKTIKGLGVVKTLDVDSVNANSAISGGLIEIDGGDGEEILSRGICLGREFNPTAEIPSAMETDSFSCRITGLLPLTKYYFRAYVKNTVGIYYGSTDSLVTTSGLPSIGPLKLLDVRTFDADMESNVLSEGDAFVQARGICFSKAETVSIADDTIHVGTGSGKFTATLKSLRPNTTYYARSFAKNSYGVAYSDTISFKTINDLPVVTTMSVTDIADGNAKVGGTVLSKGYTDLVSCGICWATHDAPTTEDKLLSFSPGIGLFSGYLQKIDGGNTYYVRAYATNRNGTSYGETVSFKAPSVFVNVSSFMGLWRIGAAGFSALGKAYIVGGDIGTQYTSQVWEYDPSSNYWRDRWSFPLGGRKFLTVFSTDTIAYAVGGLVSPGNPTNDFYRFNPMQNDWDELTPFPGNARWNAGGVYVTDRVSKMGYGYIIGGRTTAGALNEVWRYNPRNGEWLQAETFPVSQFGGIAVSKNDTIFAGLGQKNELIPEKKLWSASGDITSWKEETSIPSLASAVFGGVIFNECIYVIDSNNRIWEYNIKQKVWIKKSTLDGPINTSHCMFLLNGSIYIGMSEQSSLMTKYDPVWDN